VSKLSKKQNIKNRIITFVTQIITHTTCFNTHITYITCNTTESLIAGNMI